MASIERTQALLLFRVGPVHCCAPSAVVDSVIVPPTLTRVPGSDSSRPGVFRHSGRLVGVTDLRSRFGVTQAQWSAPGRIIITRFDAGDVGFWVDAIEDIIAWPGEGWGQLPAGVPRGVFTRTLVRGSQILLHAEFSALHRAHDFGYLARYLESAAAAPRETARAARGQPVARSHQDLPSVPPRPSPMPTAQAAPARAAPMTTTDQMSSPPRRASSQAGVRSRLSAPAHNRPSTAHQAPDPATAVRPEKTTPRREVAAGPRPAVAAPRDTRNAAGSVPARRSLAAAPASADAAASASGFGASPASREHTNFLAAALAFLVFAALVAGGYLLLHRGLQRLPLAKAEPQALRESDPRNGPLPLPGQPALPPTSREMPEPLPAPAPAPAASLTAGLSLPAPPSTEAHASSPLGGHGAVATPAGAGGYRASIEHDRDGIIIVLESPGEPAAPPAAPAEPVSATAAPMPVETPPASPPPATPMRRPGEMASAPAPTDDPATSTPPETTLTVHTVVRGDTLWGVAARYVHDPFRYPELARLSHIRNPNLIYPGEKVRIVKRAPAQRGASRPGAR